MNFLRFTSKCSNILGNLSFSNTSRYNCFLHTIPYKSRSTILKIDVFKPKRYFSKQNPVKVNVKHSKSEYRRLLSIAKSEKWTIIGAVGCLFVSSAVTMSVPFVLGKILDIIYSSNSDIISGKNKLDSFCLVLAVVFVLGGIANFARVYLFSNASLRITKELRNKLYKSIIYQEACWFDKKGTGELISRLSTDVHSVGNSLSHNLSDGLRNTVMVITGAGMMIYTSSKLAFLGMCIVPCLAGMMIVYGRFVRKITKDLTDKVANVMKIGEEKLSNIKTVKTFGKEDYEVQLFDRSLTETLLLGYKEAKTRAYFYGMTGLSGNFIIISVLYYGGTMVSNQELTIGLLTSFLMYAAYTAISLGGLSNFFTEVNKSIGSATRIWEIMDSYHALPKDNGIIPKHGLNTEILFSNVKFSYPTRDTAVLNNFNLILKPGTVTAIVGRSGSGKSTIASILLRLYEPQEGCIKIGETNINSINLRWLRKNIGIVSQEPILFSGTIKENILYGLDDTDQVSEEEFSNIIKEAHVDEIANRLPDGLNSIVGQRGAMLSGGQKQRIAIARALIKKPSVLILDEATSSLDTVSEKLIQSSLSRFISGRTVLTIAHRLSTIINADAIAVLQEGKIVEYGSYNQLIAQNGVFKQLVQSQTFSTS